MKSLVMSLALAAALAGCDAAGGFTVENAKYQPPVGASDVGVAYFTIKSAKAERIVKVSSTAAKAIEMHGSTANNGMMSMERRQSVDLPAGKRVEFKPGGLHLMVFSPAPIGADATFPITIELESGLKETIQFPEVRGR